MKYAKLWYRYPYTMQSKPRGENWDRVGNLGDCIQTYAIDQLYRKLSITSTLKLYRDQLPTYSGEELIVPMQGWFGDVYNTSSLPASAKIVPAFFGFHLSDQGETIKHVSSPEILRWLQRFQPIGCRDIFTKDLLQDFGIRSYFSGCMTLTLDKRRNEPKNGKVLVVDVPDGCLKTIKERLTGEDIEELTHYHYFSQYPVTDEGADEMYQSAVERINYYREKARLIITGRIHCAMPCAAMGIPVVFVTLYPNDVRYSVIKKILPIYTPADLRFIEWPREAPDMEALKVQMIRNAGYCLEKASGSISYDNTLHSNAIKGITAEFENLEQAVGEKRYARNSMLYRIRKKSGIILQSVAKKIAGEI